MGVMVDKQNKFAGMIAQLIIFAQQRGYQVTFGDAYRDPAITYGHPESLHKKRLAVDLNLFKDGEYMTGSTGHDVLGKFWTSMGGSWGGDFADFNHYSLKHEGMR